MRAADLTDAGREAVEAIARRHEVGVDAVLALLDALERGGGVQAQFSHPDLGGMGQWSRGGMIMVGDMFNSALKARVDALCTALADLVGDRSLYVGGRAPSRHGSSGLGTAWWPEGLGTPTTSGAQNDLRYAFFPETRRLAIGRGAEVDLYDTGEHRIHGVSQQQGVGQDLVFTSQLGTVALHELARTGSERAPHRHEAHAERAYSDAGGRGGFQTQSQSQSSARHDMPAMTSWAQTPAERAPPPTPRRDAPAAEPRPPASDDDIFAKIERLHELQKKGILSEAEFAEKKKELLARI